MQITERASGPGAPAPSVLNPEAIRQVDVLNGGGDLARQLDAYHGLSDRWRTARGGERAALAQSLSESAFGQKVQSALNAFTRAAWAGPDAAAPAPQERILAAFRGLDDDSRTIVASLQTDPSTGVAYASSEAYGRRLEADLDAARTGAAAPYVISLSDEARARLAGGQAAAPQPTPAPASDPDVAAALAAYGRLG